MNIGFEVLTNPDNCVLEWSPLHHGGEPIEANAVTFGGFPLCRGAPNSWQLTIGGNRGTTNTKFPGTVRNGGTLCFNRINGQHRTPFDILLMVNVPGVPLSLLRLALTATIHDFDYRFNHNVRRGEVIGIGASIGVNNRGRTPITQVLQFEKTVPESVELRFNDTSIYSVTNTIKFDLEFAGTMLSQTSLLVQPGAKVYRKITDKTVSHSTEVPTLPGDNIVATSVLLGVKNRIVPFTAIASLQSRRGNGTSIVAALEEFGFNGTLLDAGSDYASYAISGAIKTSYYLRTYIKVDNSDEDPTLAID